MNRISTSGKLAYLQAIVTTFLIAIFMQSSASAFEAEPTLWNHNGSVMLVTVGTNGVFIRYKEPKVSLKKFGIISGTLLFDGQFRTDGLIFGTARTFRNNCPPAEYYVSGSHDNFQSLIDLYGASPVRASDKCQVKQYSEENANATLIFEYISVAGANVPPVAEVQPNSCGWYTILACGKDWDIVDGIRRDLQAYDAETVDTSDEAYPNFRSGFMCVVLGPHDKFRAQSLVNEWKSYGVSEAYTKNACN